MLCFPNCKINLGLYITERRDDGYHNLETIFYPVTGLKDALEIVPAQKEASLHISGKSVAGDSNQNLVWKAYQLIRSRYLSQIPPLDIYLHKAIPMGAGMGGGSADGAFMLHLLNDYFQLNLDKSSLAAMALTLGSDCPFFIYNTPQLATGRGEEMSPVNIDLSSYSLQLICPEVHISTAKAFSLLTPKAASFNLKELPSLPIDQWKYQVVNDFELPIFSEHPALKEIKEQLYRQGALYAAMSGSGSTVFGIFPKNQKAQIDTTLSFEEHIVL